MSRFYSTRQDAEYDRLQRMTATCRKSVITLGILFVAVAKLGDIALDQQEAAEAERAKTFTEDDKFMARQHCSAHFKNVAEQDACYEAILRNGYPVNRAPLRGLIVALSIAPIGFSAGYLHLRRKLLDHEASRAP